MNQGTNPPRRQPVQRVGAAGGQVGRPEKGQDHSVEALLDRLEDTVGAAKSVPFSNNCMVDREEMLVLLRLVREALPEELRQAKWLLEQNRQLIAEARKEYDAIVSDAKEQMTRMIDEHEITIQARNQADQLIDDANQSSRQIRASAINYTKDMLTELEDQLTEMLVFIQKNKKELS